MNMNMICEYECLNIYDIRNINTNMNLNRNMTMI